MSNDNYCNYCSICLLAPPLSPLFPASHCFLISRLFQSFLMQLHRVVCYWFPWRFSKRNIKFCDRTVVYWFNRSEYSALMCPCLTLDLPLWSFTTRRTAVVIAALPPSPTTPPVHSQALNLTSDMSRFHGPTVHTCWSQTFLSACHNKEIDLWLGRDFHKQKKQL